MGKDDLPAIRHSGSCTLTIIDSSESERGRIDSAIPARNAGGTIYLEGGTANGTVLILKSGFLQSSYNGDCIFNTGQGCVTITGTGTVQNNSMGAAIQSFAPGKFTVSKNALVTSRTSYNTIDISVDKLTGPVLELTGGTIENTSTGYAVYSAVRNAVSVLSAHRSSRAR